MCVQPVNSFNAPGTNSSNQLYARYRLPAKPTLPDPITGYYKLNMTVSLNPSVSVSTDLGGARVKITGAGGATMKIGQQKNPGGSPQRSFPIVGDWDVISPNEVNTTSIIIPLGVPCNITQTQNNQKIIVYDADNGLFGANEVKFRVKNNSNGLYLPLTIDATPNGTLTNGGTGFKPNIGATNKQGAYAFTKLEPLVDYQLEITGLAPRNTIDIGLPQESIFGDPDICDVCTPPNPDCTAVVPTNYVEINGAIGGGADTEVGGSVTFQQSASVSGMPDSTGEWGWNEIAVRRAVNTQTPPNQASYDANQGNEDTAASAQVQKWRLCAGGNYNPTCGNYRCQNGSTSPNGVNGCGNYNWQCHWVSPNGVDKINNVGWAPPTPGCRIFQYQCRDASGNWTNDVFKDYNANETTAETNYCTNRFNCPAPSGTPTFYNPSYGPGVCDIYYCAYAPGNLFYAGGNNPDGNCSLRCNNGAGDFAPLHVSGDEHCYIRPYFQIRCAWTSEGGVSTTSEDVFANGTYCSNPPNNDFTKPATTLADVCIESTPINTNWIGTPPGKGRGTDPDQYRRNWIIDNNGPVRWCAKVGQRPYFHVYGGDVEAASTFGPACTATATTVQAFNNDAAGGYTGSGSQLAVFARGAINGFTSNSQNNPKPLGLTFANSSGGWGGNYALSDKCIPNTEWTEPQNLTDPRIIGRTVSDAQEWHYYGGDVYITGNINYPATFNASSPPSFKLVTTGNIYISSAVSSLSGIYMTTGKIYTCAIDSGSGPLQLPRPVDMKANCSTQLQVRGSFTASQVKLLRTVGTTRYASPDPRAASSTGLDAAAELFFYTPEAWIQALSSHTQFREDSIVNLPPIL